MNLKQRYTNLYQRWDFQPDDKDFVAMFNNRVIYALGKVIGSPRIAEALSFEFAYVLGLKPPPASGLRPQFDWSFSEAYICKYFSKDISYFKLVQGIQCLFWALEKVNIATKDKNALTAQLVAEIRNAILDTPGINIQIAVRKRQVLLYPSGAKLLDESLVNDNLAWLKDYPQSLKSFEQALSIYLSGDKAKYRNLIDNLRVALEQLLREILGNKKSLENQTKELSAWLDKHGVHAQTKNLYAQLLFGPYAAFQNDAAKHGDEEILIEEIEYMIYLTGTFMRLLMQLHESEI